LDADDDEDEGAKLLLPLPIIAPGANDALTGGALVLAPPPPPPATTRASSPTVVLLTAEPLTTGAVRGLSTPPLFPPLSTAPMRRASAALNCATPPFPLPLLPTASADWGGETWWWLVDDEAVGLRRRWVRDVEEEKEAVELRFRAVRTAFASERSREW
jgi:hypothetical protein